MGLEICLRIGVVSGSRVLKFGRRSWVSPNGEGGPGSSDLEHWPEDASLTERQSVWFRNMFGHNEWGVPQLRVYIVF